MTVAEIFQQFLKTIGVNIKKIKAEPLKGSPLLAENTWDICLNVFISAQTC